MAYFRILFGDPLYAGFLFGEDIRCPKKKRQVSSIATQEPRINGEITVRECRLIASDGTQMGIYRVSDALRLAGDEGLDLVEIAPNADPVVCRIMDYGKYKYDQEIRAKQARKNQSKIETKEMKFRPKIDVGDYTTKKKHILRFLEEGNKVKITIMFRGREMAHPEQGLSILERLAEDLKDLALIEASPKMEGRNMFMQIAPLPASAKKKKETEEGSAPIKLTLEVKDEEGKDK
ncbi:MAG: translation initiation factor IF-3 [Eggerthellaceae bacterium]|nr:translation initiation factor IF-3 [Eggerthellaceae bacterium]